MKRNKVFVWALLRKRSHRNREVAGDGPQAFGCFGEEGKLGWGWTEDKNGFVYRRTDSEVIISPVPLSKSTTR